MIIIPGLGTIIDTWSLLETFPPLTRSYPEDPLLDGWYMSPDCMIPGGIIPGMRIPCCPDDDNDCPLDLDFGDIVIEEGTNGGGTLP